MTSPNVEQQFRDLMSKIYDPSAEHANLLKAASEQSRAAWSERYPTLALRFTELHQQFCIQTDQLASTKTIGELVEGFKRDQWALLTILAEMTEDLPIAAMHDVLCAQIDQQFQPVLLLDKATREALAVIKDDTLDVWLAHKLATS